MRDQEVILSGYRSWSENLDAFLRTTAPDVELHMSGLFPDFEAVYRGHSGLAEMWHQMHGSWEEFRIEPEEVFSEGAGSYTVAIRFHGRGTKSGLQVEMRFSHAIRIRDGLIAQVISRRTIEEARAALDQVKLPDSL